MSTRSTAARDTLSAMRAAARPDRPPVTVEGSPVAVEGSPVTGTRNPVTDRRKWEETNRKMVFYCPEDVEELIRAEMRRSGRSKSSVIAETLRQYLQAAD